MIKISNTGGSGTGDIGARVYHNAHQAITNATDTILAFNSERWDTDIIHDLVTNNSRLTVVTAGKYVITFSAVWADNSTGLRQLRILLNGTTQLATVRSLVNSNNLNGYNSVTTIYNLATNDYIEAQVHQNSGVTIDLLTISNSSPEFSMQLIA